MKRRTNCSAVFGVSERGGGGVVPQPFRYAAVRGGAGRLLVCGGARRGGALDGAARCVACRYEVAKLEFWYLLLFCHYADLGMHERDTGGARAGQ